MNLTLGEAAKHAGRAKATLSQALKSGRLSGEKNDDGSWSINPAELQRWLDANRSGRTEKTATEPLQVAAPNGSEPLELLQELAAIRAKLEAVEGERERERSGMSDQIADLRARLDASEQRRDTAENERRELSQRLLPAPEKAQEARKGWFGWFRTGNA